MSIVPAAHPDPRKIRELIWRSGHSQADFARKIGRPARTLYSFLNDKPTPRASIPLIRQIAEGLGVRPSDISDWTGDDGTGGEAGTPGRLSA